MSPRDYAGVENGRVSTPMLAFSSVAAVFFGLVGILLGLVILNAGDRRGAVPLAIGIVSVVVLFVFFF